MTIDQIYAQREYELAYGDCKGGDLGGRKGSGVRTPQKVYVLGVRKLRGSKKLTLTLFFMCGLPNL